MNDNVKRFMEMVIRHFPFLDPIYEIGAFQVPSQEGYADMRPYFPGKQYIGCDMRPGPGVDRIEDVHALSFSDNSIDTLIILETLEHVKNPFKAIDEIYRVLKDDGLMVLSVPFNIIIHSFPDDYWRFTPSCIEMLLEKFYFVSILWEKKPHELMPDNIYAVAMKNSRPSQEALHRFVIEAQTKYGIRVR